MHRMCESPACSHAACVMPHSGTELHLESILASVAAPALVRSLALAPALQYHSHC
jgi:hypothetical protein